MNGESTHEEELFTDGWRDPGDDTERLAYYIFTVVGGLVGVLAVTYAGAVAFQMPILGATSAHLPAWVTALMLIFGAGGIYLCARFLVRESRYWDKKVTAEKLVAGGFLTGIAIILVGLIIVSRGGGSGMTGVLVMGISLALGAVICEVSLLIGLVCAFAPRLIPPRHYANAWIEEKYALDDKAEVIQGHPCPWEDGMIPVLRFKTLSGEVHALPTTQACYESAQSNHAAEVMVRRT